MEDVIEYQSTDLVEPELIRRPKGDVVESRRKIVYERREWLNQRGYNGNAYIACECSTDTRADGSLDVDVSLSIADCSRTISLDFSTYDDDDRENSIYKMDLLVKTLTGLQRVMKQELKRKKEAARVKARQEKREAAKAHAVVQRRRAQLAHGIFV